jgi:transposase
MGEADRTPSDRYTQDWPAYRQAQENEKPLFLMLLKELCKDIEEPEHVTGRTPFSLRDMIFSLVLMVYSTVSTWRFSPDLLEARLNELIGKAARPNSLSEYMRKESLTPLLQHLIVKSSLPLTQVENVFAVDSTGLGIPRRRRWYNKHKRRSELRRDYIKLHIICGVKTNIITCAEVTEGTANDSPYLKKLLWCASQYFNISELSADAGYVGAENMRAVILCGGTPYIAFRKNCSLSAEYKSTQWLDALYLFKTRHPEFMKRYYLRNNVEATFSALKAKFGGRLRSKSRRGQFNEALCKVLCHNLCVLIQSMFELGIDPSSWAGAKRTARAEAGTLTTALTNEEREMVRLRIAASSQTKAVRHESPEGTKKSRSSKKTRNSDPNQGKLFE